MESRDGVATVWIDNPPVNSINVETAAGIALELETLDDEVRVVVLRGRGEKAFSAGADLAEIRDGQMPPGDIQPLADIIEGLPIPVVAAIHGHCLGGGLELALACDIRIARPDARLSLPEAVYGLIPGGGGTQRLPRLIGRGRAAWMMMSAASLSGVEAERWGLVDLLFDDLDIGCEQVAGGIAAHGTTAIRELKELLFTTRDERDDQQELDAFARLADSDEARAAIDAFFARRAEKSS